MKNFKDFITEKTNLSGMSSNYRRVFPRSSTNLQVLESKEKDYGLTLLCIGYVKSETDPSKRYKVAVQLHRKNENEKYSIRSKCEIRCQCNAFRYNISYPSLNNKELYGKPPKNFRIPNKVRNPGKIETVCKHLYSYIQYLIKKGVISR